ncbi:MAG: hypothetical protein KBD26_02005 [Candidatus Pacebacteria bacterium]|nr:hypothetical protein [Candidatus Paceibacterota bacterium]
MKNDNFNFHRLDEETMEGNIVESVLDDDFYKFSMGQFIWDHPELKETEVEWHFNNRTKSIQLGNIISEKDFFDQIEGIKNFGIDSSGFRFLRGLEIYGDKMFSDDYLNFLKGIKFPEISFGRTDEGQLDIKWKDTWNTSMHAEMPILRIVSGLYVRAQLKNKSKFEREAFYAEGIKRLALKVARLKEHKNVVFSDFANRRTPSPILHEYMVVRAAEELGKQFKGTSKTSLAMKHGLDPIGTWAHELAMIITALRFDGSRQSIEQAQIELHTKWLNQFGEGIALSLPDTYGTQFTLDTLPDEIVSKLKGFRIDSEDPFVSIPRFQERFVRAGIDYKNKLFVPSDELNLDKMIAISDAFGASSMISHGWGGGFGNDFGFNKVSIICKPYSANGKFCVKLSDNVEKAIGEYGTVKKYKEALNYKGEYAKVCIS